MEEHARPQKKPKSIEEDERQWRLHVLPVLRSRKVADVTSEDILRLLVKGYSNPEIAQRLHLAPGTVRNYVSGILQKLGVSDRTQAAVTALQRGLVDGTH